MYLADKYVLQGLYYGLTGDHIPDLSFDFKGDYLTAGDVQKIVELFNKYGEILCGFPPQLKQYKNVAVEFITSVLSELEAYLKILEKLSSKVTDKNISSFKQDIIKSYKKLKAICDDRELSKYTARYYNQYFAKAKLTKKVDSYIGDFAAKFGDFLGKANLNGLDQNNIVNNLIGRTDSERKNVLRSDTNVIKKAKGKALSWVSGTAMRFVAPNIRELADSEALYNPIEFYQFGQWVDYRAANACLTIMDAYATTTLNGYPIELSNYTKDSRDVIRFAVGKLKEIIDLLNSLSKSDLSFEELIGIKAKFGRALALLKKQFEKSLLDGSTIHDVMIRAANRGENKPRNINYITTGNAAKKAIIIDGWSLGDFLTPLLECVKKTIDDLDNLIDSSTGEIDYDSLGIKKPPTSNSRLKRAGKAIRNFFTSSKENADILKKHKLLISYLVKAQDLYNDSKSFIDKVNSLQQSLTKNKVPIEEETFNERLQGITDIFNKIKAIYNRIVCDKDHNYRRLNKLPVLIDNNGKVVLSSLRVLPNCTATEYAVLVDYIARDVLKMQEKCNSLSNEVQDLLHVYEDTISNIAKERSKLSDLLENVINTKRQADSINDNFSKWKSDSFDEFFSRNIPPSEQIWFDEKKRAIDNAHGGVSGFYESFKNLMVPLSGESMPIQLSLINGSGKINTDILNSVPLSQMDDVIKHSSRLISFLQEDFAKLQLDVDDLKKDFEKKKKDYISERSKLEKLLNKAVDVVKDSYEYTDESRSLSADISLLSEDIQHEFEGPHNEVLTARNTRDRRFSVICKYKPDNSDTAYVFIDKKNNIGSDIKKLDLDALKKAIKDCSESLKALEGFAKDVAAKEKALLKRFSGNISALEKERKKLAGALKDVDKIYDSAKNDYNLVQRKKIPSNIGSYKLTDTLTSLANSVKGMFNELSSAVSRLDVYKRIRGLPLDELKEGKNQCENLLPKVKHLNEEIHSDRRNFENKFKELPKDK